MKEDDYTELAERAISRAEGRSRDDSIESFYRGLKSMIQTIQERLECASSDGVDLNDL